LASTPRYQNLADSYKKEYERLGGRIGQLADKRKAQFDRAAFE